MYKKIILITVSIGTLCMPVAGRAQTAKASDLSSKAVSQQLTLQISAKKDLYLADEPIDVTVTLTNNGKTASKVGFDNPDQLFQFDVLWKNKKPAVLTAYGRGDTDGLASLASKGIVYIHKPSTYSISPGGSFSMTYQINRFYDMTLEGSYQVVAHYAPHPLFSKPTFTVTSPPLLINMDGYDVAAPYEKPTVTDKDGGTGAPGAADAGK